MDSSEATLFVPTHAPHPGETVLDYLEYHNWSQMDLARRTGLTAKTISEICNGKAPVTPATALAFEKVFQRPAHLWLNLQRQYDEALARQRAQARSSEWKGWAAKFPLSAMRKRSFVPEIPGQSDVDALLTYLGVSSPDSWSAVWDAAHVAYRQTRKFTVSPEAVAIWVRETEIEAAKLRVAAFDEQLLRDTLPELRKLTLMRVSEIMDPLQALCARAGVAVVWVPELPHTGISGCARWLSNTKAVIALTLRYKTDDQMWFTFFHELAHILLHRKLRTFILDNPEEDVADGMVDPEMRRFEEEANRFASDVLIPPDALAWFLREHPIIDNDPLKNFAHEIGIGPGILVGRLQREGVLKRHQGNRFKQKLEFAIQDEVDPK